MLSKIPQQIVPEFKVTDYKKSLEWFTTLAGFKVEYDRPEHEFAMLSREGAWLMIEQITKTSRIKDVGELAQPLGRGMPAR